MFLKNFILNTKQLGWNPSEFQGILSQILRF